MSQGIRVVAGTTAASPDEARPVGTVGNGVSDSVSDGASDGVSDDGGRAGAGDRRTEAGLETRTATGPAGRRGAGFVAACALAVAGTAGSVAFGVAWATQRAHQAAATRAETKARTFLIDLTNFDSKTVDADFSAITSMATGTFAGQANKFFDSSIRQELQQALASSRGQVRDLYVQSVTGDQATVYAVVTQLYTNDKITSPQSDVLRMVVDLRQTGGTWKVADVTVLEGPSLSSGGSGSAGAGGAPSAAPTGSGSTGGG